MSTDYSLEILNKFQQMWNERVVNACSDDYYFNKSKKYILFYAITEAVITVCDYDTDPVIRLVVFGPAKEIFSDRKEYKKLKKKLESIFCVEPEDLDVVQEELEDSSDWVKVVCLRDPDAFSKIFEALVTGLDAVSNFYTNEFVWLKEE